MACYADSFVVTSMSAEGQIAIMYGALNALPNTHQTEHMAKPMK
jgi:hypothetical protein